jgi:hypothetical protein
VFEDRPAYRLLAADLRDTMTLRMAETSYFAGVDVNEAVAHELAAQVPGLPLRTLLGDPRELSRRSATMAITTLTLRGKDSFVLHWRDPRKVTHAGGLYQVMPVGVFQPGPSPRADFELWHGMVREFSEEFLGGTEDYGPGFAYPGWPFYQRLQQARTTGGVRAHCLGLGVDPLTLAVDLLTVAAFEKDVFDELFHDLVEVNAEGTVSLAPFNGEIPAPMQPAGAAVLELAWRHRKAL